MIYPHHPSRYTEHEANIFQVAPSRGYAEPVNPGFRYSELLERYRGLLCQQNRNFIHNFRIKFEEF